MGTDSRHEDWREGLRCLKQGSFWEAHEEWEAVWHDLPDSQAREATQALIQFAAACYKVDQARAGRGAGDMQRGMEGLIERARGHLDDAGKGGEPETSWGLERLEAALSSLESVLDDWRRSGDLESTASSVRRLATELAERLAECEHPVAR